MPQPPPEVLHRALSVPITRAVKMLAPGASGEVLAGIEERFRLCYDRDGWQAVSAYPGVDEALGQLHAARVPCYVVTSKRWIPTMRILDHLRLRKFFLDVVCVDSVIPSFPTKSDALRHLVVQHALDPGRLLVVGDSPEDLEAATAVGADFRGIDYGYGSTLLMERIRPTQLIQSLVQVLPLLSQRSEAALLSATSTASDS